MVDNRNTSSSIVVDAGPLIYLAKLEALDVFAVGGYDPLVPEAVIEETTRPAWAYRHPDAVVIEVALNNGTLKAATLSTAESNYAQRLRERVPGLHEGECEVLAIAVEREVAAVVFERQARAIARARGIALLDLIELLLHGTPDNGLLERRFRRFAEMVDMRLADFERIRDRIAKRSLR